MISQSVFTFNESSPLSTGTGRRILALKNPLLTTNLFNKRKTPEKLAYIPIDKSRASEILTCFKPPEFNRFKYSRLSYDYSASPKKQKNFLLKPLRKSFDFQRKKIVEGQNLEPLKQKSRKKVCNQRVTIFDKGPNDLVFKYLEDGCDSDSDESIYMENKLI